MLGIAVGAVAIGALAIGALVIGRLAIRRMLIGGAKFKSLGVGELTVTRAARAAPCLGCRLDILLSLKGEDSYGAFARFAFLTALTNWQGLREAVVELRR
jgi:hypothetical protein